MEFRMKNKYETGEEFYQDIKKHLIKDGFVTIKTDNETLVEISEEEDEWYQKWYRCLECKCTFMTDTPEYCPGCGKKIAGRKKGNEVLYYWKGDKDGQ